MEADRPDEADVPPDGHADRRDDQAAGGRAARPAGTEAETRSRQECYDELRVAEAKEKSVAAQRTTAEEQAAAEKWNEDATESRWMWAEYQRKWPPEERKSADRPDDPSGSRRAANSQVEAACDKIAELERDKITPAMRAVESQEPDRHLVGLDDRLKDSDRIKDKVSGMMKELSFSAEEAIERVPDAIRYTFEYREAYYTQGVWADIGRLKEQGFELHKLRNAWSDDQYKGINSQWIDTDTGQRFEVQFHTHISYEAKQLTHDAYERLRTQRADVFEELVLEAFQRKVSADVPVPNGATDVPNHP